MVQWTPLIAGMFLFRIVLFFLGMVWLRHMIVSIVIFLRDIHVERENDGLYRLTTYADGMQTSVLLHGETQGELLKTIEGQAAAATESDALASERVCEDEWQGTVKQSAPIDRAMPAQAVKCFIASSMHPAPC